MKTIISSSLVTTLSLSQGLEFYLVISLMAGDNFIGNEDRGVEPPELLQFLWQRLPSVRSWGEFEEWVATQAIVSANDDDAILNIMHGCLLTGVWKSWTRHPAVRSSSLVGVQVEQINSAEGCELVLGTTSNHQDSFCFSSVGIEVDHLATRMPPTFRNQVWA